MQKIKSICKIRKRLTKLLSYNKNNINKFTKIIANPSIVICAYRSIQKNKTSVIGKTNLTEIKNLCVLFKKGKYIWQKNILNLKNKIFVKLVKLILVVIYMPIFESFDKSFQVGIKCLNTPRQISNIKLLSLKGEIKVNTLFIIDLRTVVKILKKKIVDLKFLTLIKIVLKNIKKLLNSSIYYLLLNIYLHEFDLYIFKKVKNINKFNNALKNSNLILKNKQCLSDKAYKFKAKQKLVLVKKKTLKLNVKKFQSIKIKLKSYKQKQILYKITKKKCTKQIMYNRYYKNWVLLTNWSASTVKKLKKELLLWLKRNLKFKWHLKKITYKNLETSKLKYAGFCLFLNVFKNKQIQYRNKVSARKKTLNTLFIDIDNSYLKNKLFKTRMIKLNNKPTHIVKYCSLKPLQIVKKFFWKLKMLIKYYAKIISTPNKLIYYCCIYKFSCLKTLAYQVKKSLKYTNILYYYKLKNLK